MRLPRPMPFVLAAALSAAPALADEIYRWVDANGELHYTNDPATIPADRRSSAKVTKGNDLTVVHTERRGRQEKPAPAPPPEETVDLEAQWRARFRKARERVARLEADVAADRAKLANPSAHGIAVVYDIQGSVVPNAELDKVKDRLARNERELETASRELDDLDREASREAVPREWRR